MKFFLNTVFDFLSLLITLRFVFNGVERPGTVSAGETAGVIPFFNQILRQIAGDCSVLTIKNDLLILRQRSERSVSEMPDLVRCKQNAARNKTMLIFLLRSGVN